MIVETYPSLRMTEAEKRKLLPQPHHKTFGGRTPSAADKSRADQFKITPEEFVRRDDIVRQMFLDCDWKAGDVLRPIMQQEFEDYGFCTVKGIFKSYHDFPTLQAIDWPKDDKPLILTVEPEKKSADTELILCTPKYLMRKTGGCC